MDDDDYTIPYILDTITNSPAGHQILTQAKKLFLIVYGNV